VLSNPNTAGQINKTAGSTALLALLQALLRRLADQAAAGIIGRAPVKNLLQGAATAQALIALVEAALAPTG